MQIGVSQLGLLQTRRTFAARISVKLVFACRFIVSTVSAADKLSISQSHGKRSAACRSGKQLSVRHSLFFHRINQGVLQLYLSCDLCKLHSLCVFLCIRPFISAIQKVEIPAKVSKFADTFAGIPDLFLLKQSVNPCFRRFLAGKGRY